MGLFGKSKKEEKIGVNNSIPSMSEKMEIPSLPELPRLPELTRLDFNEDESSESLTQLPSYPANLLGDKFSQNAIKESISGKKGGEEVFRANEFSRIDNREMMRRPLTRELPGSEFRKPGRISREVPEQFREAVTKIIEEPIFIRIDKF